MMDPIVGQVALGLYAVLLGLGGIMGYVKAASRPSLIAGVTSAVIALIALVLTLTLDFPRPGFLLGLTLAFVLTLMFLRRLGISRKFMPSGLLSILSGVMVVLMLILLV